MPLNYLQLDQALSQALPGLLHDHSAVAERTEAARASLDRLAGEIAWIQERVTAAGRVDPFLRCAYPVLLDAPLDTRIPLPALPDAAILVAADGSHLLPEEHAEVPFGLLNFATVQMEVIPDRFQPPVVETNTLLQVGAQLIGSNGLSISAEEISLLRDIGERELLAEACSRAPGSIGLVDGPIELWGSQNIVLAGRYQIGLERCRLAYQQLHAHNHPVAGYVDQPRTGLVVRSLEAAILPNEQLLQVHDFHPFQGVSDRMIYRSLLQPGERSITFRLQARSGGAFPDDPDLAVHFFYLNVAENNGENLARVEVPGWVAGRPDLLDSIHALLYQQCRILANAYPYLLHRAHEQAVVSRDDEATARAIITGRLEENGIVSGAIRPKQAAKLA